MSNIPLPPKPKPAPVPPPAPAPKPTGGTGSTGSTGGRPSSGGGKSGGSGGSGGGNPYDKYLAQQKAEQRSQQRKAARRYRGQADTLESQANALQKALRKEFKGALRTKLANVNLVVEEQKNLLLEGYADRVAGLKGSAADNEDAASSAATDAVMNRTRERTSALSEVAAQGAGESDALRASLMSLRNWEANQGEVSRSYFDTLRSVNSSLADLNVDTKSGLANVVTQGNADREQLWTNYFNQRSESLTQLGNIRLQQADLFGQAREIAPGKGGKGKGKGGKGKGKGGGKSAEANDSITVGEGIGTASGANTKGHPKNKEPKKPSKLGLWDTDYEGLGNKAAQDRAKKLSDKAFQRASKSSGRAWKNPGIDDVENWEGDAAISARSIGTQAPTTTNLGTRPEGATLRKW